MYVLRLTLLSVPNSLQNRKQGFALLPCGMFLLRTWWRFHAFSFGVFRSLFLATKWSPNLRRASHDANYSLPSRARAHARSHALNIHRTLTPYFLFDSYEGSGAAKEVHALGWFVLRWQTALRCYTKPPPHKRWGKGGRKTRIRISFVRLFRSARMGTSRKLAIACAGGAQRHAQNDS